MTICQVCVGPKTIPRTAQMRRQTSVAKRTNAVPASRVTMSNTLVLVLEDEAGRKSTLRRGAVAISWSHMLRRLGYVLGYQ
jgi:hypothetical protein